MKKFYFALGNSLAAFLGMIGLIVTLFAMRSNSYRLLSQHYQDEPERSYVHQSAE